MLDAALAVGLNFDGNTLFGRMLLQAFGRHISVSNARRAGCDGKDLIGCLLIPCHSRSGFFCRLFVSKLFRFSFCDESKKFVLTCYSHETINKIRVHEERRQAAQYVQMDVVLTVRCGNEEKEFCWLSVEGIKFHAIKAAHKGKTRTCDSTRLGMRNGNALANTCTALFFPLKNAGFVRFHIGDVSLFGHETHQGMEGVFFVSGVTF